MNDLEYGNLIKIRKEIFLAAYHGRTRHAHLASAYSLVEILYSLYINKVMKYDISNPHSKSRDQLILSKGHGALALYCVMAQAGFFPIDNLRKKFCFPGTSFGGEPHLHDLVGVEASTGSLGHGLSIGVGMALANKMDEGDKRVFVIVGDGECQEGTIWEAAMSAKKYRLDNITVIMDQNEVQEMGTVEEVSGVTNWSDMWCAFGWDVLQVDGHDVGKLTDCLAQDNKRDMPRIVIAKTVKGKGVPLIEGKSEWHYRMPNPSQLKLFKTYLNITDSELE